MKVYVDNAATTVVSKTALDAMMPCFTIEYGNPSSVHRVGQEAARKLDEARNTLARILNAESKEIYFTGSGTEADNWAIHIAA